MNTVLFYGGFALAAVLLLTSIFLFFFLKVPTAITYFVHYKRSSMMAQANFMRSTTNLKRATAMRSALLEQNSTTTFIDMQQGGTTLMEYAAGYEAAPPHAADNYAVTSMLQNDVMDADGGRVLQGITEVLDRTEVLPEI